LVELIPAFVGETGQVDFTGDREMATATEAAADARSAKRHTKNKSKSKAKKTAAPLAEKSKNIEKKSASDAKAKAEKSRIKFEGVMSRDEAVAYFEAIVVGLKKGAIKFRQGDDALSLAPGAYVEVSVKAARKNAAQRVSFDVSWIADDVDSLQITTE